MIEDTCERLIAQAQLDWTVLDRLRKRGDDLSGIRCVMFTMVSNSESVAASVQKLVVACKYGEAWVEPHPSEGVWRVHLRRMMSVSPEDVCVVSGGMAAVAWACGMDYEGISCGIMSSE